MTPEGFRKFIQDETVKFADLIKANNITVPRVGRFDEDLGGDGSHRQTVNLCRSAGHS